MPLPDLITLTDLKVALDRPLSDTTDDDRYEWAISAASAAVRASANRDFNTDTVTEAREWLYDGAAMLQIDDAISITEVRISGESLPEDSWMARPYSTGMPYMWLELPPFTPGYSGQMGFTRGLDKWNPALTTQRVAVDGTWGWTEVPLDVQQATIWTAALFADNPTPYVSENIEGYSYTRQNPIREGVPQRARQLLVPYARPNL